MVANKDAFRSASLQRRCLTELAVRRTLCKLVSGSLCDSDGAANRWLRTSCAADETAAACYAISRGCRECVSSGKVGGHFSHIAVRIVTHRSNIARQPNGRGLPLPQTNVYVVRRCHSLAAVCHIVPYSSAADVDAASEVVRCRYRAVVELDAVEVVQQRSRRVIVLPVTVTL